MLFNSLEFLLFFPIVTILFFLLPHKYRWFHLLVASCVFYMFFIPIYIVILFATIVIDYFAGISIESAEGERRKWFLILSLVTNIGILAVFKYYNFFVDNFNDLFHLAGIQLNLPLLRMILPIGLSFHTFQAMSYTIEVYWGGQKAERNFGIYALYVMFYPQLVAGPIERPQNLLYQFHTEQKLDYDNIARGLRLMLWGLIKKVVIADRLNLYVNPVFNHPTSQSAVALAIGAVFFCFQVFCDFSGYSDIAIGAARVMGYKLMTNFNKPFHSRSIAEFWTRWHISLATWFKDYMYNPIVYGGDSITKNRIYAATFIIFLTSGLWHGANWTYVIWGGLHGFYLVFAVITRSARERAMEVVGISKVNWLHNTVNVLTTFVLVAFASIFFRANNVQDAFYIIGKLGHLPAEMAQVARTHHINFLNLPGIFIWIIPGFACIAFLELAHIAQIKFNLEDTFNRKPAYLRWAMYYAGFFMLLFLGVYEKTQFIYFQF